MYRLGHSPPCERQIPRKASRIHRRPSYSLLLAKVKAMDPVWAKHGNQFGLGFSPKLVPPIHEIGPASSPLLLGPIPVIDVQVAVSPTVFAYLPKCCFVVSHNQMILYSRK